MRTEADVSWGRWWNEQDAKKAAQLLANHTRCVIYLRRHDHAPHYELRQENPK